MNSKGWQPYSLKMKESLSYPTKTLPREVYIEIFGRQLTANKRHSWQNYHCVIFFIFWVFYFKV